MTRIWVPRTIGLPLDVVARRLPRTAHSGRARVELGHDAAIGAGVQRRCEGRWRDGRAGGTATVELSRLSAGVTQLDLGLEGRASRRSGEHLADAVCRAIDPTRPLPATVAARPRRGAIGGAAAAAVVGLVALVASQLLAPPPPVALDEAVAAYRAGEEATTAAPAPTPTQAAASPQRVASAQPDAARPARRKSAATAPAQEAAAFASATQPDSRPTARRQAATASSAQPSGDPPAQEQPERELKPGVYSYDTAGYEEIDRPSTRHTYPSQTTITVRRSDCGFVSRWQPFDERWDEMDLCVSDGGGLLQRMSTNREFYGQRQRSDYICERGSVAWVAKPGATWRARCSDGETTINATGNAVGWESLAVDGRKHKVLRFVIDARLSGENTGRLRIERWIDADTGLLVRYEGRTEVASQTGLGTVSYREELSLRLQSATPRT